jgi:Tfp pilus assembly PilM family ATPase
MIRENEMQDQIVAALIELEILSSKYNMYAKGTSAYEDTRKVLYLLQCEIAKEMVVPHERILRAMHDIGMSAYKDFENTKMERLIQNITTLLSRQFPFYKTLKPLRSEFGKGDPI